MVAEADAFWNTRSLDAMSREEWDESQESTGSSSGVSAKRLAGIMSARALMPLGF